MQRRDFIKICAAAAATGAQPAFAAGDLKPRFYSRVQLVDESRQPLRASRLAAGENYVFHYPFEGTPCFLLDLGRPTVRNVQLKTEDGGSYSWPGGVGPNRAIVGYSAICAHRMSYPTRQISFISYREKSTASKVSRPNTIHCCSEHSEYDPASGARVLGGPAPQPLSAILLEHDGATDTLYAIGTLGGEMFNAFFAKFEFRLALDYGPERARKRISDRSVVTRLDLFCKQQVRC
ncbi:MAG: (2Fe-2S)-binding protein [Betaproteobacteria bacterium]|nr:(2Fe-2S)-binding protein [Betaproteobacteria bacterium]